MLPTPVSSSWTENVPRSDERLGVTGVLGRGGVDPEDAADPWGISFPAAYMSKYAAFVFTRLGDIEDTDESL